jgi:outer membrane receptor protein involved in Fe transport
MQLRTHACLTRIVLPILLSFFLSPVFAQTIRGKVFDSHTGEPLIGANVTLQHTQYTTSVQLDGSFTFKHVAPGKYTLVVSTIGYQPSKPVDVEAGGRDQEISISMQSSAVTMQEVQVSTLGGGGSDNHARRLEQNAAMVENLLSARTIELSPDITVANALQRVSGVTIARDNSGDGRYAIIRGMDQRYNNVLVNGIKIPSPDDVYRFVPMSLFPSEMLERLEVIKALTPSMEGDAIGGTMNLVMKNAPDHFLLTGNVSGGYSTIFSDRPFTAFIHSGINKQSPAEIHGNTYEAQPSDFTTSNLTYYNRSHPVNSTYGVTVGDRFAGGKLGIILSGSYQSLFKGTISDRLIPDAQPQVTPGPNSLNPAYSYVRQFNTQTQRFGLQNKIDYVINSRNKLSLFNMYVHQDAYETRFTPDSSSAGLNSTATATTINPEYRSTWQIQNIYNATLQGDHQLSNRVNMNWTGAYSIAKQQLPDQATISWNQFVVRDVKGNIDSNSNTIPNGTSNVVTHRWEHNSDQDLAGYGNLTYKPTIFHHDVEFTTGGMYRYKTRTNYDNEYAMQANVPNGNVPYTNVWSVPLYFQTSGQSQGITTAVNLDDYTAHEKVGAGYLQTKFMALKSLQVLGGVRVENTQFDYLSNMPVTADKRSGTIHYTDVLPSVHFKYNITGNQAVRLSYFKSISRPGFHDLIPYIDNSNDEFSFQGNPNLKHTRADNLDLRWELFPKLADQILVGVFYKKLVNPIEYYVANLYGPSSDYIMPENSNPVTNYGAEAVFTKFFGKFGINANYTYTHSRVTTPKHVIEQTQTAGIQTINQNQTRPLQGQADHIGNLSLLYKDQKIGLDVQLAFSYTGTRIAQVSPFYGLDIWAKPFETLDLSLEKRITHHIVFFGKINNLTDAPNKEYIKYPYKTVNANLPSGYTVPFQDAGSNYTVAQKDYYRLSFLAGFRYKF